MNNNERITELITELQNLRVRETHLLEEVAALNNDGNNDGGNDRVYSVGQRIVIINTVRRPVLASRGWLLENEKRATVTKVKDGKVFYTTDDGTNTWDAEENVRPLVV